MTIDSVTIRAMRADEMPVWGALRTRLWPDCLAEDNQIDFAAFTSSEGALKIVFLAFAGDAAIGFAEISERNIAGGCGNDPVAYLEGWYVEPEFQGQNVGGSLIAASADWALKQEYEYLASDVELDNSASQGAHLALGFEETGRVVTYRKRLAV